jgi:predicted nucleic acid-binding protein
MRAILDTGPWVALIDRSESRHKACVDWFKNFRGSLYSTEAVLTEVLYLLNFSTKAQIAALDFMVMSIVEIVPADKESIKRSKSLIKKYADLPMDYADATIVCLASDAGIRNIVTFDIRDFNIYRLPRNKSFRIIF